MSAEKLFIELVDRTIRDTCICFRINREEITAGTALGCDNCPAAITVRVNQQRFFSPCVMRLGGCGSEGGSTVNHLGTPKT